MTCDILLIKLIFVQFENNGLVFSCFSWVQFLLKLKLSPWDSSSSVAYSLLFWNCPPSLLLCVTFCLPSPLLCLPSACLPCFLHAEVNAMNTENTHIKHSWLLGMSHSYQPTASLSSPPLNTHTGTNTHTHTHLPRYPGDSDGCQLLCCRKLWPLYEDPWVYFIQDGVCCTYCVHHKEPWVFFTQTLLFLVIRNALCCAIRLCGWASGAGADTEQRLSALKCDKNSACSSN